MHRLYALLFLVALGGCATPATSPAVATSPSGAGSAMRQGVLAGDPSLEGGCVWLETDGGRLEVAWPAGYRVTTDPIELRDPTGAVVATRGDRLRVRGMPAPDRVSTCQVGQQWTADEVAPLR